MSVYRARSSNQNTGIRFPDLNNTMDGTSASRVKSRLQPLSDRFQGFEEHLNLTRTKKKEDEDKRITSLQKQLSNLKAALTLESSNRAKSIKALQAWATEEMVNWTAKVQLPLEAKISALTDRVDNVTARLETLEKQHQEDRKTFPVLIETRCNALITEIREFKAVFERDKLAREERDKRVLVKIREQGKVLKSQFSAEKDISEKKVAEIRKNLADEISSRTKSHALLSKALHEELDGLRTDLALESKERESANDEIIAAVNHYTAAIQDGLKIVAAT